MKLLYVLQCLGRNSETFISDEIIELLNRGHQVIIFTQEVCPDFSTSFKGKQIYEKSIIITFKDLKRKEAIQYLLHSFILNPLKTTEYLKNIFFSNSPRWQIFWATQVLPYQGIEHVHVHFADRHLLFAEGISALLGIDFTVTMHGYDIRDMPLGLKKFKNIAKKIKKIVNVSEDNNLKIQNIGIPESKLSLIPCGIKPGGIRYSSQSLNKINKLKIISIARLHPIKRLDLIIKAISILKQKGVIVYVTLIGDGTCEFELKNLAKDLNILDQINFKGALEHEDALIALLESDIHILCSDQESLGISNIEAMVAGLAVIVTDVGGLASTVVHKVNGYKVKPNNPMEIAEAICFYHTNREKIHLFGKSAREYAIENFSRNSSIDKLMNEVFN